MVMLVNAKAVRNRLRLGFGKQGYAGIPLFFR